MRPGAETAVVGAGLVGSLLALELGRRGAKVTVFERRPDMRRETISAGRSINLAVSARGIHALNQVDLKNRMLEQAVPMRGRMIHSVQGELSFQPYGRDDSECIYSISRAGLNRTLMDAAEDTGQVQIRFREAVDGVDFSSGTLRIRSEGGPAGTFKAQTIFGTDGSASVVRREILNQKGATGSETPLDYAYKELAILPADGPQPFKLEKNALHIWPRGTYMLIALPNIDGSFTVTLFLPLEGSHPSFETLKNPQQVRSFFAEQFVDALPLIDNLEGTFFSNPTGRMVTLHTDPWSAGDRALLLGDAAHAIVPFFGQGMNCGFEDVTLFFEELDRMKAPREGFFESFGKSRKTDTDAIARMAVENFIEMRDKVGNPRFLLEKEVEKILMREFSNQYISRYGLVTFHRVPYRVAWEAGILQDGILSELCAGLGDAKKVDLGLAQRLLKDRLGSLWQKWKEHLWI